MRNVLLGLGGVLNDSRAAHLLGAAHTDDK